MAGTPCGLTPFTPETLVGWYPEEPFYLSANPRNKGTDSSRASSARKAQDILPAQLKNNSLILTASHKNILSQRYS